jgi:hypothetical protein
MQVPRENETERTVRQPVDDTREVTKENAERRCPVRQRLGPRLSFAVARRVDADDTNALARHLDSLGLVTEKPRGPQVAKLGGPGERVAGHGDIVVSEHDERAPKTLEEWHQPALASRVRNEIPGHADEIGSTFRDPLGGAGARDVPSREQGTEVKVGEVANPKAVEGRGKRGHVDLEYAGAKPARLEPAVRENTETDNEQETDDDHQRTLEAELSEPTTLRDMRSPPDGTEPVGLRHTTFVSWLVAIVALVGAQSVVHLSLVLGAGRIGTAFDLDRSNGVPDLVSTAVLAAATSGALALTWAETGNRRLLVALAAGLLAVIMLADLLHDGAHPARSGFLVIGLVVGTVALLAGVARTASARVRTALAVGICLLAASFLVSGLDRASDWFRRDRGEAIAEWRIVFKEGFELAGWSLVALGLWDAYVERRAASRGSIRPLLARRHDP